MLSGGFKVAPIGGFVNQPIKWYSNPCEVYAWNKVKTLPLFRRLELSRAVLRSF